MALNIRKFLEGIRLIPKSSSTIDSKGEFEVLSSTGKAQYHNGSTVSPVVTEAHSASLTNKTIDATSNTISNISNTEIKASANIARDKLASGNAYRVVTNDASGVMSDAAAITASRALASDANGIPVASATTATELGYVSGVTSAIQTQIDAKVTGPAVATDNAIVRYDLTTGKLVQNSGASVDDSGNISATNFSGSSSGTNTGDVTLSSFGSSPSANGASLSGQALTLQPADATHPGGVSTTTQAFAGEKEFVNALMLDQVTTPSNPASGKNKLYFKNDDTLYFLTSGGTETAVGTSSNFTVSAVSSNISLADKHTYLVDTSAARSLALPTPTSGVRLEIKDSTGSASTNNISITSAALIEGQASPFVCAADYGEWTFVANGTNWFIL